MTSALHLGNSEILQIADAVSREKSIERDLVLEAMESSIAIAARKKYGHDRNINAEIDRKTGEIRIFRELFVVDDSYQPPAEDEELEEGEPNPSAVLLVSDAKDKKEDAVVGDIIREPLPPIDLGRVAAQTAKQVIFQKVREAERERQYNDFKGREGEISNGIVKRIEFNDVIVELGNAEAVIKRDQVIKGESFRPNDRVRAYIKEVSNVVKGPQIFLSRTTPEFMAQLFAQEVPEIYDGIIEVKGVAREPGSRAKIAVHSNDHNIDPVGSCVGMRGARVQAVIAELQGEKIDIIQWSVEPATFLVNALAPAEVSKVVIDEDNNRIEVVVPDDQLSLAIGRRGQNVRLASELVGWRIDVMSEEDESTRRTEEFNRLSGLFVEALNIEEIIAHLLVSEGFSSLEEIAYVETEELTEIEGFDEDVANELKSRAAEFIEKRQNEINKQMKSLKIADDFKDFEALNDGIKLRLAENDILTLDDFADLSRDEFVEFIPDSGLTDMQIDDIIMQARAHWFEEESDNEEQAASN